MSKRDEFFTKANIETIVQIFQEYMKDNYQITFTSNDEIMKLRANVFNTMQQTPTTDDIHDRNIFVLGKVKSQYVNKENMLRDQELYKNRKVFTDEKMRPVHTSTLKQDSATTQHEFERLQTERQERRAVPDVSKMDQPIKEDIEDAEEFINKLNMLEAERKKTEDVFREKLVTEANVTPSVATTVAPTAPAPPVRTAVTPPPTNAQKIIVINSCDREWQYQPPRYQYAISLPLIKDLEVVNLIIPEEVYHTYLTIQLDDAPFCKLIYESRYKTPNGRDILVMKPMYQEKIRTSFTKGTLAILRPSGQLLNDSYDAQKISKIETDGTTLVITMEEFFTNSEFLKGDTLRIQGYMGPTSRTLLEYINRADGHDVLDVGPANEHGYSKSLVIRAPGTFNKQEGVYELLSEEHLDALQEYNKNSTPSGKIINITLQHVLVLKASMVEV